MDIVQDFYDGLAAQYDQLFADWQAATREQGLLLDRLMAENGFDRSATVLDCACGIGTQSVGLAELGYRVTASDLSSGALVQAGERAAAAGVSIRFEQADFRGLSRVFSEQFDVVIAMDNALPHMLTKEDLELAVDSITQRMGQKAIFIGSIRDYDRLLQTKPSYAPPYIHKTEAGQRVSFQTWDWEGDRYDLTQYILEDGQTLKTSKFTCRYRATRRAELTACFASRGCGVRWLFPEETGFYQPILIARKK